MNDVMEPGKASLRRAMRDIRDRLDPGFRAAASAEIAARVAALPEFAGARTILSYLSFRSEVETAAINRLILEAGKRLGAPLAVPETRGIQPRLVSDLSEDVESGYMGIPEPVPARTPPLVLTDIDLVLVPGLAFDPAGNRLGYGRAFYDSFLCILPPTAAFVGLCFDCQFVERVPAEPTDVTVHVIVTESRTVRARRFP